MEEEKKRPYYKDCDGFLIPGAFSLEAFRSAINYKPKTGQLFIATYPKCGATWMQQIVDLIFNKGKPAENFGEVLQNSPLLELNGADSVDFTYGPGAIKIHLPFNLAPYSPNAKYIYIARNPRDCCVSFYYHTKCVEAYNFSDGTFEEFFEFFISGKTSFGDYFDHLLSWYEHKDDRNVCFLTYEELKEDARNQIIKIAKFIGDGHYDTLINNPDILENVLKFSSLDYMKSMVNDYINNVSENFKFMPEDAPISSGLKALHEYMRNHGIQTIYKGDFVRKGVVGDWKNYFSAEQEKRMEERIKEKTAGSDVMKLWNIS